MKAKSLETHLTYSILLALSQMKPFFLLSLLPPYWTALLYKFLFPSNCPSLAFTYAKKTYSENAQRKYHSQPLQTQNLRQKAYFILSDPLMLQAKSLISRAFPLMLVLLLNPPLQKALMNVNFKDVKQILQKEYILLATSLKTTETTRPSQIMVSAAGGKFETLVNMQELLTEKKPVPKPLLEAARQGDSGFVELDLSLLFPYEPELNEGLSISLVNNGKHNKACDLPIYGLWNKSSETFEEAVCNLLTQRDVASKALAEIFTLSFDTNVKFYSYYLTPLTLPLALPFVVKKDEDEASLVEQKKQFHSVFLLDERPILKLYLSREERPKLAECFRGKIASIHTHCLGKRCLGENSMMETVKGKYYYYHYLQDNERDSGWGCAYRSLQTLISWYISQGYAQIKTPTIAEIQKALVELKDKPPKFVGSSEWIGAYEVMLCINYFLKVTTSIQKIDRIKNTKPRKWR
eukprot:TRINITY_DN316_c0_g1_i2.p1 TRINITY_DN316_c0_g1~~TRINITY_DN316_c0_g1_i2.p1  ORF type:complete len:464 (+),score=14.49 TRINITY_DN316_c0_g1_i2:140-1531(+)